MENNPKLKLSNKYSIYLENQPEQGMGYQIVDIILKSGEKLVNRVVLNSQYLKLKNGECIHNDDIKEILVVNDNSE